jgi:hypothetical protein
VFSRALPPTPLYTFACSPTFMQSPAKVPSSDRTLDQGARLGCPQLPSLSRFPFVLPVGKMDRCPASPFIAKFQTDCYRVLQPHTPAVFLAGGGVLSPLLTPASLGTGRCQALIFVEYHLSWLLPVWLLLPLSTSWFSAPPEHVSVLRVWSFTPKASHPLLQCNLHPTFCGLVVALNLAPICGPEVWPLICSS